MVVLGPDTALDVRNAPAIRRTAVRAKGLGPRVTPMHQKVVMTEV